MCFKANPKKAERKLTKTEAMTNFFVKIKEELGVFFA